MSALNTENLKQYLLLALIIILVVVLGWQMITFMPGVLGAITMYILMRESYFRMTVIRNWKKWVTALLFITGALVIFVLPLVVTAHLLFPKFYSLINNPEKLNYLLEMVTNKVQQVVPRMRIDDTQIREWVQKIVDTVPGLLSATADLLGNLALAFFLLYFMLVDGRKMERRIQRFLPLKGDNIDNIWAATRTMVKSNAIGIPLLALSQGVVATIGYYIFAVPEPVIWGMLTGVFSMLPLIGSAIIWVPVCIYMFGMGEIALGIGLFLYSLVLTGSIDNVLRFTLLKKLGDVHPLITVLGVIVGLPLFGFMGLIFGPLMISYLLLLIKIYRVEFSTRIANGDKP